MKIGLPDTGSTFPELRRFCARGFRYMVFQGVMPPAVDHELVRALLHCRISSNVVIVVSESRSILETKMPPALSVSLVLDVGSSCTLIPLRRYWSNRDENVVNCERSSTSKDIFVTNPFGRGPAGITIELSNCFCRQVREPVRAEATMLAPRDWYLLR